LRLNSVDAAVLLPALDNVESKAKTLRDHPPSSAADFA
jgi:hypothetical protein